RAGIDLKAGKWESERSITCSYQLLSHITESEGLCGVKRVEPAAFLSSAMRLLIIAFLSVLILCGLAAAHSSSSSDSHEYGRNTWGYGRRVYGNNGWGNNGWNNNGWGNNGWGNNGWYRG
ncbi:hypothetical protein PRIPAC_81751, partial [Pristionchus pacificus]